MLEILYTHGANMSLVSNSESKMCPIHWAASEGKLTSVAFLLDRQVDINIQDANGCTPVIIATQHNHQDCVVYFIHKGADMSLSDNNGDSAIHWAAYKGFVEMTGLLVHAMPRQVNSTDNFGQVSICLFSRILFRPHNLMHCLLLYRYHFIWPPCEGIMMSLNI